jgi:hypothetical protein
MRAFDLVVIILIVLLGIWCLVLQMRSPGETPAQQPEAAGAAAQAAQALKGRVDRLESSLKAVEDRQAQVESDVAGLADAKERPAGRDAAASQAPALSKADIERMVEEGIKKHLEERRGAAMDRTRDLVKKLAEKPDERLDKWISDTVTTLRLQTQDEGILKEIIQERNRKLAEELLRDPDTPPEAKLMSVFTGEFFKKVNDEMYDSLKRYYKDETLEAFKKHYRQSPPPLVVPSPEGGSVTVIHAAPGRLEVNKMAPGPGRREEEAPPQGH